MDTFMDKIAQKFNAQEMIKANAEAEEKELKRLKAQLSEYDARIQEISKLNLKNLEIADQLKAMMDGNAGKDAQTVENVHKECVKVYRNVQAVVDQGFQNQADLVSTQAERLAAQNEQLIVENTKIRKKIGTLKVFAIITMLLTIGNIAFAVLQYLEIL